MKVINQGEMFPLLTNIDNYSIFLTVNLFIIVKMNNILRFYNYYYFNPILEPFKTPPKRLLFSCLHLRYISKEKLVNL